MDIIEIPFGAKDSELNGWEYTIPEGMEAVIENGKVIVRVKESENERIRKEIVGFICWAINNGSITNEHRERSDSWLAYLEKQKELSELGKYISAERSKPGFMFEGNDSVSWEELPLGVRKHDYPYYFMGDLDCYPFNVEKKKSIIEKLREISTPADEDWLEIEKKWEAEDNEDLCSFISLKFASNAKVIDGKRLAVLTWERFKDVALDLINRGKEQESEEYSLLCNTINDKIQEYIANHFITDTVVKTDVNSIVKAMEEGVRLGEKEQKPAEWSEEDESKKERLISIVKRALHGNKYPLLNDDGATELITWLKFLRPSWKPSPEQMWAFKESLMSVAYTENKIILESLYDQLNKLI